MKNTRQPASILATSIAATVAFIGFATLQSAHGAAGTWTNLTGGSWPTGGNWSGGVVANGADFLADFSTLNITAAATVTLDGNRTIGGLKFGDATTVSHDWTLNTGTGGVLTLDVTSGQATIFGVNRTATIGTVLAGNDGINIIGNASGTSGLIVFNAVNTFTGGLTLTGAQLQLSNNSAAGANAITIATSTNTSSSNRLLIAGGITIGNNITIQTGASPLASQGALQQTGTGLATINGTVTIQGATVNGGHIVGGNATTNALVFGGAITSSVTVNQRDGFVRYGGGGTYTDIVVNGNAALSANGGLATGTNVTLSNVSNLNGTLDVGAFNQTINNLTFASTALGTVTGTTGVLTINGAITTAGNQSHVWNGNANLNGGSRTITVADGTSLFDVNIGASLSNGTLVKAGAGIASFTGTNSAAVSVTAGSIYGTGTFNGGLSIGTGVTVVPGSVSSAGTVNASTLALSGTTTLRYDLGASSDLINSTTLTNSGTATFNVLQNGGILAPGAYNLISYTGTSPGTGGFALGTFGHATASITDTGSAIALNVTANDRVIWTGASTTTWATGATGNWKLESNSAAADYIENDEVIFQDTASASHNVNITANVTPAKVSFTNTAATSFSLLNSASGIGGLAGVVKSGNGTVTIANANTYTGTTDVQAGTLVLNYNDGTARTVLNSASNVTVGASGTLRLVANDSAFAFQNNLSGSGVVEINPHFTAGTAALSVNLGGNNAGFNGTLRLLAPVGGTSRLLTGTATGVAPANLGSATIEIQSGSQILTQTNTTYTNNITSLAGIGYNDGALNGFLGALRLENGSVWNGNIVIAAGGARITPHAAAGGGTATIGGNISGGALEANVTTGSPNITGGTLILTGTNSYTTTRIGGGTGATVSSRRLNIGAGGTTGTLGTGAVTLDTDGHNAVLGFDRSDGYTLGAGNDISVVGSTLTRSFVDFDTLGAGFSDGGRTINLGGSLSTTGGQLRVAQGRAGGIANFTGNITAGQLVLGANAGFGNGTANINTGAVFNVGTVRVSTAALNNSTINFNGGTFNAFSVGLGEVNSGSGTVNQYATSTVNIQSQLRVGHFATNTSTYNLIGGDLTMTGATPNASPSSPTGGGANTYGDNNLNSLPANTLVGGGIYIGVDGQGIFNHTGGTATTNWIVLDNRAASGANVNMLDGVDQYNLSGTGVLKLRSTYGLILRNPGSSKVNFGGGGTVQVDNGGTGVGTGANINIPLDAEIFTTGTTTLDTNGAGNGLNMTRTIFGTGTLALTGGGNIGFNPTAIQHVHAGLSGSNPIVKTGTGTTTLAGVNTSYTGPSPSAQVS